MTNTSEIVIGKGGTSYNGPDAVDLFRLKTLRSGISMHQKFGMIPTRGVTITKMLGMVTAITGKNTRGDERQNPSSRLSATSTMASQKLAKTRQNRVRMGIPQTGPPARGWR